ncbi:hypothetical protein [Roseibium sp.]|uniref:hypothetical protein n=1 Tax=Roseibium sp. TaxID=1936156 RepID=UPI003B51F868
MRIVTKPEILANFDKQAVLADIENGFKAFAAGTAQVAPVVHLAFKEANGECHVKCAHVGEDDVFTVKLATGFYDNPALSISSSNGFMAVISARHGTPLAILQDEGVLTDLRTALAGVIAASIGMQRHAKVLGIVGTGIQARLQARLCCEILGFTKVVVWGRNGRNAGDLACALVEALPDVSIEKAENPEALCANVDVIITTTAATSPIIKSEWVKDGTHIVAVGADSPGKQELDTDLFARAEHIVVDSLVQCIEHGETTNALREGAVEEATLKPLGDVLLAGGLELSPNSISIADLTGVAVQDAAIAKSVWSKISDT